VENLSDNIKSIFLCSVVTQWFNRVVHIINTINDIGCIWYDIWYMIYDIWYMIYDIWYDIYIYKAILRWLDGKYPNVIECRYGESVS